jgi:hypothetical protein
MRRQTAILTRLLGLASVLSPGAFAQSVVPRLAEEPDHPIGFRGVSYEPPPTQAAGTIYATGEQVILKVHQIWRPMCGSDTRRTTPEDLRRFAEAHEALVAGVGAAPLAPRPPGPRAAFDIVYNLVGVIPPGAAASFAAAEQYLESCFTDPISVTINVSFGSVPAGVIGLTTSQAVLQNYAVVRNGLASGADADDTIQAFLPSGVTLPVRYTGNSATVTNVTSIAITTANYRSTVGAVASPDAGMVFSDTLAFDFDPCDGITAQKLSLVDVIVHETGHAMGFVSGADYFPDQTWMLDLFRFARSDRFTSSTNPDTTGAFGTEAREVSFNNPTNDDVNSDLISAEYRMSDGAPNQASHFFQQSSDPARAIGIMQPALDFRQTFYPDYLRRADKAMFDAIGWDNADICPLPVNDACADAIVLSGNPTTVNYDISCATSDGPEACPIKNDLWYLYTPASAGQMTVDLCGGCTTYDAFVGVYCGGCAGLEQRACNDDNGPVCGGFGGPSSVIIPVEANVPYLIRVGGYGYNTGTGCLNISVSPSAAPQNDSCANAIPILVGTISGSIGAVSGSTVNATPTPGLTTLCGSSNGSNDVWYTYQVLCAGNVTVDTCAPTCGNATFDTVVSVHTACPSGGNDNVLPPIASNCNDNACATQSRVTFSATPQTYYIRVAGASGASGNFVLSTSFTATILPPSNNLCVGALPLTDSNPVAFDTCGATHTENPPVGTGCPIIERDVWFTWTAPCSGEVYVALGAGASFDTALAVYQGAACPPTTAPIACNDNVSYGLSHAYGLSLSELRFNASANTTYKIRVGGVPGSFGAGTIRLFGPFSPPPTCSGSAAPVCSKSYLITGPGVGTPWAWAITSPCCLHVQNFCVPGVTGNALAVATAFAASINAQGCPNLVASAAPSGSSAWLVLQTTGCPCDLTLSVGAANSFHDFLCIVPLTGGCSFNPSIREVAQSGLDCNANDIDDSIDIILGTSTDANGNGVPDECDGPCDPALDDSFDAYAPGPVCGQNGWEEWIGSVDVCATVSTDHAFSGSQSIRIVGSVGGSTGLGDDTVHRFTDVASGRWTFKTMTFVPEATTGVGFLSLLTTYDDPPGSPLSDYRWALQVHFNATTNRVIADFNAGSTALVKGRWAEFRVEIDLDADRADYYYDGVRFVQNRSWSCGLGAPFCGTEARIQALDLYAGEPSSNGISGMYFDDVSLVPVCCPADFNADGILNSQDFFDFLAAFFATAPAADFNSDGAVNSQDFFDFLTAFFAGCP